MGRYRQSCGRLVQHYSPRGSCQGWFLHVQTPHGPSDLLRDKDKEDYGNVIVFRSSFSTLSAKVSIKLHILLQMQP